MDAEDQQASRDLYHLLLSLTRGAALDKVCNAGVLEGAYAWRLLVDRWGPRLRSRAAGQLLEMLRWSFSGDCLTRLEAFERACTQYEKTSGTPLTENLKVGIVLNNLEDGPVRDRMILNAERLQDWPVFKSELEPIMRVRTSAASSRGPGDMDVGALGLKGGKKGQPETR
eukprot:6664635-Pyramimonas_sp.AAC.1